MKLPFWATVFTVLGVVVLCSLGIWQLKRLAWKQIFLSRINAEFVLDPSSVNLDPSVDLSTKLMKRGFLKGNFLHNKAILIEARTYQGRSGNHLITPFKMYDFGEKIVFVNRGWVPQGMSIMDNFIIKPAGLMMIIGTLRPPIKYNSLVPENRPDENQWYKIKPAEIAKAKKIKSFYSNIFYKENVERLRREQDLPIAMGAKMHFSNNHAAYALFWFLMALVMVVVYFLRFITPQFRGQFK